ncbi:MAG: hypothetical protein PHN17_04280 [Syntrophaceticus sp.]|nr:hypothetical protein [Syntrophaceticus sp.]
MVTFEIRLKAGFFKTQVCYLKVGSGQIILIPQEHDGNDRVVINGDELQSVNIMSRNLTYAELEIVTTTNIYVGSLAAETDLKKLAVNLGQEFGAKFVLQR